MIFKFLKYFIIFSIAAVIFVSGFLAGNYSYSYYYVWSQNKTIDSVAKNYLQMLEDKEARKMEDTYGGKTPQETLQMFIEAVEKGDYDLASKYFIESKREEWKENLIEASNVGRIDAFLKPILVARDSIDNDLSVPIEYGSYYTIRKPVLVEFILYPNDIWKLTDI